MRILGGIMGLVAMAFGVSTFFAGTHDFPSPLRHPSVTFCESLDDAVAQAIATAQVALAARPMKEHDSDG